MRAPRCTIDTSCVIALDALDLLPQLSVLFSRVLLPRAVLKELFRRRATKDRLRTLLDSYAFLERCDEYDKGTVDVLLIERARQALDDRGETEAVVQAAHVGAMVIADDPWGRDLAGRYNLDCHGTLWVLKRLFELRLRSASSVRLDVIKLLRRGTRLPKARVDAILIEIGEAPLTEADVLS